MENMKRNAAKGDPHFGGIKYDDLRFKTWENTIKYQSNAVMIAMMDVSGSMGEFEKYIARSFYFWMVRFLRTKYNNVKIVFISHHTEAKEVTRKSSSPMARAAARRFPRPMSWRCRSLTSASIPTTGISIRSTSPTAITCPGITSAAWGWCSS